LRDAEIYRLNNETRQQVGMKVGMLELIAKEALYQITALVSFIVLIPCVGYLFRKIMNKRIAKLKGIIGRVSQKDQERKKAMRLEKMRRLRRRLDYKILMKLQRKCRIVWRFLKKLN